MAANAIAATATHKQQTLPEIPLQWKDFMWSLERLRHKPYGKKMRERDWFRVNPLEIVLLGCQSLVTNASAKRDHGTMMLVMESLQREMCIRPRYWQRLFMVLTLTIQARDTPTTVLQRCCSVLVDLWNCIQANPEYQSAVYSYCIGELKVIEVLENVLTNRGSSIGVTHKVDLQSFINDVQELVTSATQCCERVLSSSDNDDVTGVQELGVSYQLAHLRNCLVMILSELATTVSTKPLALYVQIQSILNSGGLKEITFSFESVRQLVNSIRDCDCVFDAAVCQLLCIFELLVVRSDEWIVSPSDVSLTDVPPTASENGSLKHEGSLEGEQQLPDEEDISDDVYQQEDVSVSKFFEVLSLSLEKWKEMAGGMDAKDSSSNIPYKLLNLAYVMLAAAPLHQSLPETIDFFQYPISVLMSYSTEGYLSNSPDDFFSDLIEFITSLAEQGVPPLTAVQTNLPNLFGPAFGVTNNRISCKLLEFGYLSICSQHQKSLLTEGLRFLMDVFHLFPPIDEIVAQSKARSLHVEAIDASSSILEMLLESLPVDTHKEWTTEDTPFGEDTKVHINDDEPRELSTSNEQEVPLENLTEDTVVATVNSEHLKNDSPSELETIGQPPTSGTHKDVSSEVESPVSDEDRVLDKDARSMVLLRLLQLACSMIRNGDNISFLYASVLPKLFKESSKENEPAVQFNREKLSKFFGEDPPPPASSIPWRVDKKKLAIQLLDLTILSVSNEAATPFQLCGIVVPKLIKNLDRMNIRNEEKFSLTLEVLKITRDTLEAGHDIDDLISHGIDLMSNLLPESASLEEIREFINRIATHLVESQLSSMLFLIKNACQFMKKNFPEETTDIQELFKVLLFKAKRDEIRGVYRVCKEQLVGSHYTSLRQYLYGYSSGKLSHRQLIALCDILINAMDVEKPKKAVREFVTNVEEENEEALKERQEQERRVVVKLSGPCLEAVETALKDKRFKKEVWEKIQAQLSQIALFRTLFQSEFASFCELTQEDLLEAFRSKFPSDVLASEATMQLLAVCASRIEHMQIPRYDSLKVVLSDLLRHFLTLYVPTTPPQALAPPTTLTSNDDIHSANGDQESVDTANLQSLKVRMAELEHHIEQLPRNAEDRQKLVECGYNHRLWEERLVLPVKTDGSLSLEENMRQNLLACFTEFVDILKQMAITHVSVDGEMVKATELFTEDLSLTDLKGRRAVAVRAIDQRRGASSNEGHFYERKVSLLAKEDQIEADFEKMSKVAVKPKTFTVALNTNFFDCVRCCGAQIIGCYAPTGEHCERPLEIGMRCDSAVASVYDESGVEIENAEMLFTEEGAYLFKAYTNGHPYDTSQVWVTLFTAMLKEEPAHLVPAIIVPNGFPNQRTWESLRRCVSTEMTGSMLTCRPDFSPEWRTYYDHRPERVRLGVDIVLHTGFNLSRDPNRPAFHRQRSRLTKDLAGVIFEEIMQQLLDDDWLKQFKFLGKVLSQYVSVCISEGERREDIISKGFDYDRWKKTVSRMKQPPAVPAYLLTEPAVSSSESPLPSKEAIVKHLLSVLDKGIAKWCEQVDLNQLCANSHKQLLELKLFLEKDTYFSKQLQLKEKLVELRQLLTQCTFVVPVLTLPDSLQEEVIHWIFRNEDRVWRYRGGRDGHETLQQFMNFLGREPAAEAAAVTRADGERETVTSTLGESRTKKPYAGVAVFCLHHLAEGSEEDSDIVNSLQVRWMVGYAVGEVAKTQDHSEREDDDDEEDEEQQLSRWRPDGSTQCYEVVTAWVHPSYRGLNLSVRMYLEIILQAPARMVVCDMVEGSVERIISSFWLFGLLERLRVLQMIVKRRQISYNVVMQTGNSEQFEQVVFDVRPLRVALSAFQWYGWFKDHPKVSMATVAMVTAIPVVGFTVMRLLKS